MIELPYVPSVYLGLIFAVTGLLLYYYGTRNHGYWKERGIVYEKPVPFFGCLLDYFIGKRNQGQIVRDIYNKFPNEKVVGIWNLDYPALLIRDPGIVHRIMVQEFNSFSHNEIDVDENVDPVLARNMFCQRGEKWKQTRSLLSPAFTATKVKGSFDKIIEVSNRLVEFLRNHPDELQIKDTIALYTSEVFAAWGLGIDGHSFTDESPLLPRLGKLIFDPTPLRGMALAIVFLAPNLAKRFNIKWVPDEVPLHFRRYIKEILDEREANDVAQDDYLQYFIEIRKKRSGTGKEIDYEDILGAMLTFFVEGYESSSMVTSFFLYRLAMNPDIQNRLRKEVEEATKDLELTSDMIYDLDYMNRCFMETNRLHSGLPNFSKVCTQRCELGDGILAEPGITMIIPTLALQSDPRYWNNPEIFDPDNFLEEVAAKRPKGVYMPFGEGPRLCIGARMANAVVKTAVAKVLLNFEIVPSKRTPLKFEQNPHYFMSSQKGGLYLKFKPLR